MTWAARLASLSDGKSPYSDSSDSPILPPNGPNGAIGAREFSEKKLPANDRLITVPCSRCGTASRPFAEVVNPEGWLCDACWPAWPDDAAAEQEERAAIQGEGITPALVPHQMPPSWSDMVITPTAGARCRCCDGSAWWTEATSPKGWRCTCCHPPAGMASTDYRNAP